VSEPTKGDGSEATARRCLEIIMDALAEVGARREDVVRTRTYLTDASDGESIGRVHGEVFGDIRPASTMVVVAGFLDPRWKVEVEAPTLFFTRVPEPKTTKNRVHLDLAPDTGMNEEVERLVGLGATVHEVRGEDRVWTVMLDPEGNEFCVEAGPDRG
jgi:hypothetical protein